MSFDSIVGYTFDADTYCPHCAVVLVNASQGRGAGGAEADNAVNASPLTAEESLDVLALAAEIDRMDEHSYDSDEFPKVILGVT